MIEGAASNVTDAARRIPPAGWVGIVGVGLGLGLYLRRRGGASSAPATIGDAAAAPLPDVTPTVGGTVFTPSTSSSGAATGPISHATTNLEWLAQGERYLIARGVSPETADAALHAYLAGDPMSGVFTQAAAMVLSEYGPPPEGIPAPHFTPNPTNPIPGSPVPMPILRPIPWTPVPGDSGRIGWQYGRGPRGMVGIRKVATPVNANTRPARWR